MWVNTEETAFIPSLKTESLLAGDDFVPDPRVLMVSDRLCIQKVSALLLFQWKKWKGETISRAPQAEWDSWK